MDDELDQLVGQLLAVTEGLDHRRQRYAGGDRTTVSRPTPERFDLFEVDRWQRRDHRADATRQSVRELPARARQTECPVTMPIRTGDRRCTASSPGCRALLDKYLDQRPSIRRSRTRPGTCWCGARAPGDA